MHERSVGADTRHVGAEDLKLFAITSGNLYPDHVARAERREPLSAWVTHVQSTVWPQYLREVDRKAVVRPIIVQRVALDLKAYYERHVQEIHTYGH